MWTHRRSGHAHQRGAHDHRDPYERDRTRVIHCPAFRRLQRKTQILSTVRGDFHRTRLTHSLEVASIGCSIVRNLATRHEQNVLQGLLPNDDLINTICLLHDIGHPPFGHGGETALNFMMRHHGGFEGNGQTFRLLTKLEDSYGEFGLDLTRRALLGILKYPVNYKFVVSETGNNTQRINDWLPPKAYYDCDEPEINWLLSPFTPQERSLFQSLKIAPTEKKHGLAAFYSFDCSIMNIADDIAYGVHDLEDAIHLNLIKREQFDCTDLKELLAQTSFDNSQQLLTQLFSENLFERKQAIGQLVNYFLTTTQVVVTHDAFETILLKYNIVLQPEAANLLNYLMHFVYTHVIDSQDARILEYGGQTVVLQLFEAINLNPMSLLNKKNRLLFSEATDEASSRRVICDYIANMTDEEAHHLHERLMGRSI